MSTQISSVSTKFMETAFTVIILEYEYSLFVHQKHMKRKFQLYLINLCFSHYLKVLTAFFGLTNLARLMILDLPDQINGINNT